MTFSSVIAVTETIFPIFLIIGLGLAIRVAGFFSNAFYDDVRRFVYSFSLPVLIFVNIIQSMGEGLSLGSIGAIFLPTLVVFFIGIGVALSLGLSGGRFATFVQTTYHGNVSYVGLAVVLYMLGEEGLRQASVLLGFIILVTQGLSTLLLTLSTPHRIPAGRFDALRLLLTNPMILSSLAGLSVLFLKVPVPSVLVRSMTILSDIALPLALIAIGASLGSSGIRKSTRMLTASAICKLILLPLLTLLYLKIFSLPPTLESAIILLVASPVATVAYIMGAAAGGDSELASNAITVTTLLSPITYMIWSLFLHLP